MCRPGEITVHTSPLSHSCIVTKLNLKTNYSKYVYTTSSERHTYNLKRRFQFNSKLFNCLFQNSMVY